MHAPKSKIAACLLAFFVAVIAFSFAGEEAWASPQSGAEAVIEITSGRVLFENNADKPLPMASTTKILTAIIIVEDCRLDAEVSIPKEAVGVEGSSIYLVEGERMTVKDLLYGLMLRSGNDCATALALYHSGSIETFAKEMTLRAQKIGAENSHFLNPHGLPQKGHETTAKDLAKIAAYALRNREFSDIVGTKEYTIPDGGCGYARKLINKNKMLSMFEGADGVKTGYTKEAGRCLVTSATRGNMRLVSAVLDSPDMYGRSAELLDGCFSCFSMQKLFDADTYRAELATDSSSGKICTVAAPESCLYPLAKEEKRETEVRIQLPDKVFLPVHRGDAVGKIEIYLKNQLIFSRKIVSIVDVEKSYLDFLRDIVRGKRRTCESINILRNAESEAAEGAIY